MAKALVVVESPAKVKTINKILGRKYKVTSSMGHLIDLPKSSLGVDLDNKFEPKLIVVRDKQKILTKLKKEAEKKEEIYIATDPDREGEAIGWNLLPHIGKDKKVYRVVFHEITKDAVKAAFDNRHEFDENKIQAQIARRVLDRIVGYQVSPVLWKKIGSRLSAGRVQSVALRMIVDRERAIQKFVPQEYWKVAIDVYKDNKEEVLEAALEKIDGQKPELKDEAQAKAVANDIQNQTLQVASLTTRETKRKSLPPFITSTLQQEAFGKLGFNAQRTMMAAQQLYEGMEIGAGDPVGLITYMRTDSVNIANEALAKVRDYIQSNFGDKYLPESPNKFKSKKSAQEAHEAIRPTDVNFKPEEIRKYLTDDQYKLYTLIWKRFVSCQMTPAVYQNKKITIEADKYQFGASGSTLIFDGCLSLYRTDEDEEHTIDLTAFHKGDELNLKEVKPTQHFTKPPPRFSEATLVKTLEEEGIGRPSTYAAIIQTLVYRNYVARDRGYFIANELGMIVCDMLVENFAHIMDVGFTAKMEEELDMVEEGRLEYQQLLQDFYGPFSKEIEKAMENIEKTEVSMDRECPECEQKTMVVKWGRNGRFLSCSRFPDCKHAEPYPMGFNCPKPNCKGEIVERRSRRGSMFYGCSAYPDCNYISNKRPTEELLAKEKERLAQEELKDPA